MKKISLNKAINLIFGKVKNVVKYKIYCNDGKEYSIFFTVTSTEKMYNLHYKNTGYFNGKKVMYRLVQSYNDTTGGYNCWDFCDKLNNLGYYI